MDETPTYKAILNRTRGYALSVCEEHSAWDWEDLWGSILLDCVRWPPSNITELNMRCRSAKTDWFRRNLGRDGQKVFALTDVTLDQPFDRSAVYYTVEDTMLGHIASSLDLEAEVVKDLFDEYTMHEIARVFRARDAVVLWGMLGGMSMTEIGDHLGLTVSRVSQLVKRMQPKVKSLVEALREGRPVIA